MKYLTQVIIILLVLVSFLSSTEQAVAKTARSSASFASTKVVQAQPQKEDNRAKILEAYLKKYNSPLATHAQTFIDEADKNDLDWKWVAAIAGVESYFGQQIPPYSYNAWGYGVYGNNVRRFASWDDGIATVSKALREDYIDSWGASNIYQVGSFYAADKAWANKVTRFITELDKFEQQHRNNALPISL